MITVSFNGEIYVYKGLSTDEKPLENVEKSSLFVETDTLRAFKFDKIWKEVTSQAMSQVQKEVLNSALDEKVEAVEGEGLSENNFTDEYKEKLDNALTEVKAEDVDSESATSGQVLTADGEGGASWQNIDLSNYATKNDLNNKMSNPMEATGDIIVAGANGVPTRLGIGIAGQVLKSYGTAISWGDVQSSENSANIVDFTTKVIDRIDNEYYERPYKLHLSIDEGSEPTSPNGTIFNIIKDLISNYIMFDDDDNFIPLHIDIPFAYPVAVIDTENNSTPIYVSTFVSLGIYAATVRTSMATLYDAYVLEYDSNDHKLQYNQIGFSSNASASIYGSLENSDTRITTIYDDDYLANIPCLAGYAVICHGDSTNPHDVEYVTEKIELPANIINRIKNLCTLTIITTNPTITEAS